CRARRRYSLRRRSPAPRAGPPPPPSAEAANSVVVGGAADSAKPSPRARLPPRSPVGRVRLWPCSGQPAGAAGRPRSPSVLLLGTQLPGWRWAPPKPLFCGQSSVYESVPFGPACVCGLAPKITTPPPPPAATSRLALGLQVDEAAASTATPAPIVRGVLRGVAAALADNHGQGEAGRQAEAYRPRRGPVAAHVEPPRAPRGLNAVAAAVTFDLGRLDGTVARLLPPPLACGGLDALAIVTGVFLGEKFPGKSAYGKTYLCVNQIPRNPCVLLQHILTLIDPALFITRPELPVVSSLRSRTITWSAHSDPATSQLRSRNMPVSQPLDRHHRCVTSRRSATSPALLLEAHSGNPRNINRCSLQLHSDQSRQEHPLHPDPAPHASPAARPGRTPPPRHSHPLSIHAARAAATACERRGCLNAPILRLLAHHGQAGGAASRSGAYPRRLSSLRVPLRHDVLRCPRHLTSRIPAYHPVWRGPSLSVLRDRTTPRDSPRRECPAAVRAAAVCDACDDTRILCASPLTQAHPAGTRPHHPLVSTLTSGFGRTIRRSRSPARPAARPAQPALAVMQSPPAAIAAETVQQLAPRTRDSALNQAKRRSRPPSATPARTPITDLTLNVLQLAADDSCCQPKPNPGPHPFARCQHLRSRNGSAYAAPEDPLSGARHLDALLAAAAAAQDPVCGRPTLASDAAGGQLATDRHLAAPGNCKRRQAQPCPCSSSLSAGLPDDCVELADPAGWRPQMFACGPGAAASAASVGYISGGPIVSLRAKLQSPMIATGFGPPATGFRLVYRFYKPADCNRQIQVSNANGTVSGNRYLAGNRCPGGLTWRWIFSTRGSAVWTKATVWRSWLAAAGSWRGAAARRCPAGIQFWPSSAGSTDQLILNFAAAGSEFAGSSSRWSTSGFLVHYAQVSAALTVAAAAAAAAAGLRLCGGDLRAGARHRTLVNDNLAKLIYLSSEGDPGFRMAWTLAGTCECRLSRQHGLQLDRAVLTCLYADSQRQSAQSRRPVDCLIFNEATGGQRFCGPADLYANATFSISSSDGLSIRFVSGSAGGAGGFQLSVSTVRIRTPAACNATVQISSRWDSGYFDSHPGFGSEPYYRTNAECVWADLSLPRSRTAAGLAGGLLRSVHVYEGAMESPGRRLLGSVSSDAAEWPSRTVYNASGGVMAVRLSTDAAGTPGRGFRMRYSAAAGCDGLRKPDSPAADRLQSHPELGLTGYAGGSNCSWRLVAHQASQTRSWSSDFDRLSLRAGDCVSVRNGRRVDQAALRPRRTGQSEQRLLLLDVSAP
uniref:CUB domain-containing protein n=1 Tax=Macrostomum lignano TaxID=282301 RepID=A0A1I8FJL6_9PLAT